MSIVATIQFPAVPILYLPFPIHIWQLVHLSYQKDFFGWPVMTGRLFQQLFTFLEDSSICQEPTKDNLSGEVCMEMKV